MYCVSTDVSIFTLLKMQAKLTGRDKFGLVSKLLSWKLNTDITVCDHYITPLQTVH
jgi:hypothetical protein